MNQNEESVDVEEERITFSDPEKMQYWAIKLGISAEHLRELVAQVGPRARDIQRRLSERMTED